jgi:hypothetical protein
MSDWSTAARAGSPRRACRTAPRMATSGAYSGPTKRSISRRSCAASDGLAPPVPMATCRSPRATTAGARNEQASGTSMTFRSTRSRVASSRSAAIVGGSSEEAYATTAPRRSPLR